MKKLIMAALAATALASCTKEVTQAVDTPARIAVEMDTELESILRDAGLLDEVLNYQPTSRAYDGPVADIDCNGLVSSYEIMTVITNMGIGRITPCNGDFTGDAEVNTEDLMAVIGRWNTPADFISGCAPCGEDSRNRYHSGVHIVSDSPGLNVEIVSQDGYLWFSGSYNSAVNWMAPTCLTPRCYRVNVWYDGDQDGFYSVSVIDGEDTLLAEVVSSQAHNFSAFCVEEPQDFTPSLDIELSK